ncbi:putative RNA-directed DNA polymerase [Tanacetum coccineum]
MPGDDDTTQGGGGGGGSSASEASKLIYGDELYLHPNDSSITNFINIKLKGTENYNVWSYAMTACNFKLKKEESHRGSSSSSSGTKSQVSVFAAKGPNNNNYNRKNQNNKNPNVVCSNPKCCLTVASSSEVPTSANTQFTVEQMQQLLNLINSKPGKYGQTNMADSGANQHMVTSLDNLENIVDISDLNLQIDHPNGTTAFIKKVGNLKLSDKITLYDVLYVPEYTVNLLSVHKLARDSKLFIGFDEYKCYIQDLHLKKTMRTGSQQGGLYFFDFSSPESFIKSNNMICHSNTLWHNRLGHPSDQVLKVLKGKFDISGNGMTAPCDICHRAKQTREPFPISDHKTTKVGDIVHLDVWGPYRIASREGHKYFLTIVDDYSRVVWLYLLKSKDEVFSHILVFHEYLKTQFNKTVKIFRSDNGIEFVNNKMENFCKQNGIIHQTTCPYTPQQNGIVERNTDTF